MRRNRNATNGDEGQDAQTSLEARFTEAIPKLSESRRQLLQSILNNPEEHFFLSSRKLAKLYQVDASTIVRTIQALGYQKFDDFAVDLRKHFVTRITPYLVLKSATREKRSLRDHIRLGAERDADNLELFIANLNEERVIHLARLLYRARRIVVVGVDLAASLSSFLAYGLQPLGFNAEAPVGSSGNLLHKVRSLTDKDLLIAISFGRCLRETVESVQRAHARGVPTFGITDSDTTPLAKYCDDYLLASITSPSFTGSYVVPMALMNAILVACAHVHPNRSLAYLEQTEEEYKTGSRWFQEQRRSRAVGGNGEKPSSGARKTKVNPRK